MKLSLMNNDLEYFLKVAENKTLLQAAESLGISQPALSRSISRLEDQLGFKILQRSRSGIRLTEQGETLFRRSKETQEQISNFVEGLRTGEKEIQGTLKIGAHASLLQDFIMPLLPDLFAAFPKINFQLESKSSFEVVHDLVAEKLDVGLVINPAGYSNLILKSVGNTQGIFYSEIKEPKRFFMNPQMVDLGKLLKLLRREGFDERNVFFISDYDLISQAIEKKLGCGLLPSHVAERSGLKPYGSFLHSYRLNFHLHLAVNSNQQSEKTRTLMRFLESRLK